MSLPFLFLLASVASVEASCLSDAIPSSKRRWIKGNDAWRRCLFFGVVEFQCFAEIQDPITVKLHLCRLCHV